MKPRSNITSAIRKVVIDWLDNTLTRKQLADSLGISLGSVDKILCDERARRLRENPHSPRLSGILGKLGELQQGDKL